MSKPAKQIGRKGQLVFVPVRTPSDHYVITEGKFIGFASGGDLRVSVEYPNKDSVHERVYPITEVALTHDEAARKLVLRCVREMEKLLSTIGRYGS
jgi:hypothetical protein